MPNKEPILTELDRRSNDGYMVALWWVQGTLDTFVEVIDTHTEPPTVHEIPVVAPATPAEVYNHPFRFIGSQALKS